MHVLGQVVEEQPVSELASVHHLDYIITFKTIKKEDVCHFI